MCQCGRFTCHPCAAESHGRCRQHKQQRYYYYYYYYEQYEYYLEEGYKDFPESFDHTPAANRGVRVRWSRRRRLSRLSGIGEIFGSIKRGRRQGLEECTRLHALPPPSSQKISPVSSGRSAGRNDDEARPLLDPVYPSSYPT